MKEKNIAPKEKDTKEIILELFNDESSLKPIEDKSDNKPIDEIDKKWIMNDKIIDLFIEGIKKDQDLKEKYAIILIIMLGILLIALVFIFILKGANVLNYSDSTFNIFISGGLAEVFVLVRIIVKYLFKDNLSNALNIILTTNNTTKQGKKSRNKNP